MQQLDAAAVAARLDRSALIDALERAFRGRYTAPHRQQYALPSPSGERAGTLLVMPAWRDGGSIGIKIVTVFAENARQTLPAVQGCYVLLDANGRPRALLDGGELTLRRTGAASALASRHLSRADSSRLLMVGSGRLAPHLIASHRLVRPISDVRIWSRRLDRARALANELSNPSVKVAAAADLEAAVRWADIVSCATLSAAPLVLGAWLKPGQHLDLVGSFTPEMREVDDQAIAACDLYADTRSGVLQEAGEIIGAIRRGIIEAPAIIAELADLASGRFSRARDSSITLFKSVGAAIEDLAAAELAVDERR